MLYVTTENSKHCFCSGAIRSVGNSEVILSPTIAVRLMGFFANIYPTASPQAFPGPSDRARDILGFIAQSKNAGIASRLYLSPKTLRNHVSNILRKLQVATSPKPARL